MPDADAIARKLDYMRPDIEEPGSSPAARLIARHAASLLAAVEAALKLADEAEPVARDYGGEPIWWSLTPAELRAAITAALTEGEGGNG